HLLAHGAVRRWLRFLSGAESAGHSQQRAARARWRRQRHCRNIAADQAGVRFGAGSVLLHHFRTAWRKARAWLGSGICGRGQHRQLFAHVRCEESICETMTMEQVRIDKWLWAARFFKTRSLATDAVDAGRVRLDGERIKPARNVKCGDLLQIDNGSTEWEVVVRALADKRGSAEIAQKLYTETESSMAKRQQ